MSGKGDALQRVEAVDAEKDDVLRRVEAVEVCLPTKDAELQASLPVAGALRARDEVVPGQIRVAMRKLPCFESGISILTY